MSQQMQRQYVVERRFYLVDPLDLDLKRPLFLLAKELKLLDRLLQHAVHLIRVYSDRKRE